MRAASVVLLSSLLVFALPVSADEKPTEEYQKAMHDMGAAIQTARAAAKEIEDSGAGAQDYMPFDGATTTMKASFATTLAFWQARKVDDAIKLAEEGALHASELEAGAKERDYRVVLDAMIALTQTCESCHAAHRTKLPDGTLGVK